MSQGTKTKEAVFYFRGSWQPFLKPGAIFPEGIRSQESQCCHQRLASSIGKPLFWLTCVRLQPSLLGIHRFWPRNEVSKIYLEYLIIVFYDITLLFSLSVQNLFLKSIIYIIESNHKINGLCHKLRISDSHFQHVWNCKGRMRRQKLIVPGGGDSVPSNPFKFIAIQ